MTVEGTVLMETSISAPTRLREYLSRWAEREQELGDGQGCCECCLLDMTMVSAPKISRQIRLPEQGQAVSNSSIDGEGAHSDPLLVGELLVTEGCWGRGSHFSSRI